MSYQKSHIKVLDLLQGYDLVFDQYDKYRSWLDSFYKLDFSRFVSRNLDVFDIVDLWAWDWRLWQFLNKLNYNKYLACDISQKMIDKHPGNIKKLVFDLDTKFPIESDQFDLASAFFVLEHLADLDNFFEETYRILREWGVLIIWYFIQRREFVWKTKWESFKIKLYKYKIEEIKKKAEHNFFEVFLNPVYEKWMLSWYIIVCEKK